MGAALGYFSRCLNYYKNYQSNLLRKKKIILSRRVYYSFYMLSFIFTLVFIRYLIGMDLVLGLFFFWLSFLLFFLQVLFFTTCERKLLALTQRRVGPQVVGDRGRLQYFADALKLILKG